MMIERLAAWMREKENEHLEFKEAKTGFDSEKLIKYCVAFANERGGHLVLGVTDKRPRKVVGSQAFQNLERIRAALREHLPLRVEVEEVAHPDGRVLVFSVPSRSIGMPVPYKGAYWMRSGGSLVSMTPDVLQGIFAEAQPDFSSEICPGASLTNLHPDAIKQFRKMWRRASGNQTLENISQEQLLTDAELLVDGKVTYAALIILGTRKALGKFLAQAECIFEYRSSEASTPYQQRQGYREGFLLFYNKLWDTINLRNEIYQYQEGLIRYDIPGFNESVIREAVLNAVSHRDYRLNGSVFVRQFPAKIEVESPGGFPPGITVKNILDKQSPRNRRIAEVFAKCGFVERSGQGANRMFEESIKEGKLPPDFTGTDGYQVLVTLHGEVRDPLFLRFFEQVGKETYGTFNTQDFVVLDLLHREKAIPEPLRQRLPRLRALGVIESIGRKYILSKRFYRFVGKKGVYTRKRGLDRETNKALLLKHIQDNNRTGSRLQELQDVLPALTRVNIKGLLQELKREGRVHVKGRTKGAKWYP